MNISSSDKDKLREEIDSLNQEQKELSHKLQELECDLEQENGKKRQLERDINELSLQINA